MRKLSLCAGLLCGIATSASANAPFAPRADVPDYIGTMGERASHPNREQTRTVMHHGEWTRVETQHGTQRTIAYFTPAGPVEVQVFRSDSAGVVSAAFLRGRERRLDLDTEPRNTGERQTVLGETCTVWSVLRSRTGFEQLSCVTDDGIELWYRSIGGEGVLSSAEATRIERRPVTDDEVRPPRELLMLRSWQAGDAPSPGTATPDYETVMTDTINPSFRVRTTRRHGGWDYIDETSRGGRHSRLRSATVQLRFWTEAANSVQRLSISKSPPIYPGVPLNRSEKILADSCDWFDMQPGIADGGRTECRTHDGIVLKENNWSRSSHWTLVVTRISRRAVSPDEVTPSDILDPKYWGLD